jgi:hypothetical protein
MKNLYESILGDMDDVINKGDDDVAKTHILEQLHDRTLYWYPKAIPDDKAFIIKKKGNKWIVDLKTNFTCYGTKEGYVTDGSFSFGVAAKDFIIMGGGENNTGKCNIKSLKYGPYLVNGQYCMIDCIKLKNLNYCPKKVMDNIVIADTNINTLKYFPEYVKFVEITHNKNIKAFDICPTSIKDGIRLHNNGFKSNKTTISDSKIIFLSPNPVLILDKKNK